MSLHDGAVLAHRYRVVGRLGSGGSATAYRVWDEVNEREVALKLLHGDSKNLHKTFREEFELLRGVVHPHLTRVYDYGLALVGEPRPYFTAEVIEGKTLLQFARGKSWVELERPITAALDGLAFLHRLGIRHGDFAPDNVVVTRGGRGVLIDLSCSQRFGVEAATLSGRPGYLAPELLDGEAGDIRSDLYSVGVCLSKVIETITGPVPQGVTRGIDRLMSTVRGDRPDTVVTASDLLGLPQTTGLRPPLSPPARLIGRRQALEQAKNVMMSWSGTEPNSRVLCFTGASGVGRTRMLEETKWLAQRRWPVVEGGGEPPGVVGAMLSRSVSATAPVERLEEVLGIHETLEEPTVFVLDDLHRLDHADLTIFRWFVRTLDAGLGNAFVLCSGLDVPEDLVDECEEARLLPLSEAEVGEWLSDTGLALSSQRIARATGGYPRELSRLLVDLRAGDVTEGDIRRCSEEVEWSSEEEQRFLQLSTTSKSELIVTCMRQMSPARHLLPEPLFDVFSAAELLDTGWLRVDGGQLVLQRPLLAPMLVSQLDEDERRAHHVRLAEGCAAVEDDRAVAGTIYHLCLAGEQSRAEEMLCEGVSAAKLHPEAWVQAARVVGEQSAAPEVERTVCEVLIFGGEVREALKRLSELRERAPDLVVDTLEGEALARLGESEKALTYLRRGLEAVTDDIERARIIAEIARLETDRGQYDAATAVSAAALDLKLPEVERATLHYRLGVAMSYLGDTPQAREHLAAAGALSNRGGDARGRVRALSAAALVEYRASKPRLAAELYQKALVEARQAGLPDLMVSLSLNLATAHHQLGDWARANELYQETALPARALGLAGVNSALEYNSALLDADIGLFDLAHDGATRATDKAAASGQTFFEASGWSLLFEIGLWAGDTGPRPSILERSRELFDGLGAERERLWVDLQNVRSLRLSDDLSAARRALDGLVPGENDHEMAARVSLEWGRLLSQEGNLAEALPTLEQALADAEATHQRQLVAEIDGVLSETAEAHGAHSLALQYREKARASWERVAAGLPASLLSRFWQHPLRAGMKPSAPVEAALTWGDTRVRRLLEINKKLTSAHSVQEVVEWTMDAAIELSDAERGFLILVDEQRDRLHVPVARNVDREQIGRSHLKFSRTIAQQVMSERSPIVTTDAAQDPRFGGERSVHAMRLKSVCAVPVQGSDEILGAIYLDNRFRRSGFDRGVVELLSAFADQVAIALTNARLHERLEARTEELERERRRIAHLLEGESQRVEALSQALEVKQRALEHRFDYSRIVGSSVGMQRVFEVLDHVIDRPLTVLIEGESGTGKELCARAVHFNSSRRDGPFVAVNCGALPEPLLESELFGHVRGAFTGADQDRPGLFVAAGGGTLFLDELGEMSRAMQVKLLRVLEDHRVRPLGSTDDVEIDVRLVCATNRDLEEEVAAQRFRSDLFYRVAVARVSLPPLRDRRADIPMLCEALLKGVAEQHNISAPKLSHRALRALMAQPWPGNVRQLENVLTLAALTHEGSLDLDDLELPTPADRASSRLKVAPALEKRFIEELLEETGWNIREAAKRYGVSRPTFYRKLRIHRLDRPRRES